MQAEAVDDREQCAQLRRPEGNRSPRQAGTGVAGARPRDRGRARRPPSVRRARPATSTGVLPRAHLRRRAPEQRRQAGLDAAPQRVRHVSILRRNPWAAYRAPARVSAAGNAHCPGTPATARVREASLNPGTVESGIEHEPVVRGLEIVLGDEPLEQPVVPIAAPEAGCADHLGAAVHRLLHAKPALPSRALERLVPEATKPGRTGLSVCEAARPVPSGPDDGSRRARAGRSTGAAR